ncbi:kinase-like domain-containing protein [Mycena galericulata]|nr:kinase-like domain-containing protein [Mycena galericulata]
MQLLLWPSGEPTIKARTAIVPSHHCAWLVKALLPLRGPKRFDIKAWPWTKNPQPNIRPDALSAPQDSPASPSRSSDQVNAIMQVDFEPGVWGYLEPLVPSPGVERITFREPCLMQGVNFGRSPSNDFVLKGAGVSHLHATIQWNGTRDTMSVVTLTDWRSKNGTFVDNIKVQGTHQLFDGSLVSFASKVPVVQEATDFRYIFRHPYGRSKSETVFSHYIVSNKLGGGAYGTVFRAMERKSGKVFAMKTACKSIKRTDTITCAGQETMALMLLNHTNVCKLHEVFFRIDGNIVDIILEFVDGLNLHDYIEGTRPSPLNEAQMKELAFQICTGLAYVHGAGVSHGDLKPDNILVSRGDFPVVKLVDFGLARVIGCYNAKPMITTHSYTAPEAPKQNEDLGESIQIAHSMVWDNWALGCIFYYLLSYTQLKPGFIIWDVLNGRSDQGERRLSIALNPTC